VFGWRTTKDDPASAQAAHNGSDTAKAGGKGRPTPSRKDAEAARKKLNSAPRTRKEAAALQRERTRAARTRQRSALDGRGSDRDLPTRDQGPVKGFIRDWVDSHFTVGQFLLPFMFVMFVLTLVRTAWANAMSSTLFLSVIMLLIVDSVRVSRSIKKGIEARFGKAAAAHTTMYALLRAWQMRRLRLPKPRVSVGDQI
jgi:hypothetical protein